MISIPTWFLVVLIVTNIVSVFIIMGVAELICYIHDMIQVEIHHKKYKRK